MEQLTKLQEEYDKKEKELAERQQYSPEKYENLQKLDILIRDETNLETDNCFAARKYLESKFNM